MTHSRALIYCILGFTLWVFADVFMRMAGEAALPPTQVVGFLGGFMALFMVLKAAPAGSRGLAGLWPRRPEKQFLRCAFSLGSNLANAVALKHLPLAVFYVAVFLSPLLIVLLAALLLREHISWKQVLAVLAGFVGVVLAMNPFGGMQGGDWTGFVAVMVSNICFALSVVWLRRMTQTETIDSIAFSTGILELLFGLVALLFIPFVPVKGSVLLLLAAMGLFCLLGNLLNYLSLRHLKAATVEQFHYTQLVGGAIIGYLVWQEIPAWHTFAGAAIIIAAGFYVAALSHRESRLDKKS